MPQKGKLSVEEKAMAVNECLTGQLSIPGCAAKYGVSLESINTWIRLYESRGVEGLTPTSKQHKYSIDLKQYAVADYLSGKSSLKDICKKYDISDTKVLRSWIKLYNGHKDFKQPNNGGATYMTKGRKTTLDERLEMVSHCIANNRDYGKTIEQYEVSYQQIYGWVQKYEKLGIDGLIDRRGKCKAEDSLNEVDKLKAEIKLKNAENLRLKMENELLKKLKELEGRRR